MIENPNKLNKEFFIRDVLEVAPELLGKNIVIQTNNENLRSYMITEVEAYRGEEDKACHASKGRTDRTDVMYWEGGVLYVYLIYGMYWMLNIVTGAKEYPQAVLIRGLERFSGPGKLTRELSIDGSYNKENIIHSSRIYLTDGLNKKISFSTHPRIGIDYAGVYWKNKPWRYLINNS